MLCRCSISALSVSRVNALLHQCCVNAPPVLHQCSINAPSVLCQRCVHAPSMLHQCIVCCLVSDKTCRWGRTLRFWPATLALHVGFVMEVLFLDSVRYAAATRPIIINALSLLSHYCCLDRALTGHTLVRPVIGVEPDSIPSWAR